MSCTPWAADLLGLLGGGGVAAPWGRGDDQPYLSVVVNLLEVTVVTLALVGLQTSDADADPFLEPATIVFANPSLDATFNCVASDHEG